MIPATVTSVAPLEVLLDGATTPSPAVLVSGAVELNGRVYVEPSTSPLQVTGALPAGLVTQDEVDALEAELLLVAGGKLAKTANLADLTNAAQARANLGLDETGSTGGALLKAQNLADVPDKATARTNLGVDTVAHLSDLTEAVQDIVAGLLGAGSNVTLTYDDAANTLTLATSGGATDPEVVRDVIGVAMAGVGLLSVTVNDALDTITISTTATANSTDAQLRDRATHTGAQAISTVTGLQTALDRKLTAGRVVAGRYYSTRCRRSTIAPTLNRVYATPFYLAQPSSMDLLGINVTVAGAAGSVARVGLYADSGTEQPGALLFEAGSTLDCTTTGAKEVSVAAIAAAANIAPGWVWLACVVQGATCTLTSSGDGSEFIEPVAALNNGTVAGNTAAYVRDIAAGVALPTPFAVSSYTSQGPRVYFRGA